MENWAETVELMDRKFEPRLGSRTMQEGSLGGGPRTWRNEDPTDFESVYRALKKVSPGAAGPSIAGGDQCSQMESFGDRLSVTARRELSARRARQTASEGRQSVWTRAAIPAAAHAECAEQIDSINGAALSRPPPPKQATRPPPSAVPTHRCFWKNGLDSECGLQYRFKKDLKAHQLANGGAHQIFTCNAKVDGDACGKVFFSKESLGTHKNEHKASKGKSASKGRAGKSNTEKYGPEATRDLFAWAQVSDRSEASSSSDDEDRFSRQRNKAAASRAQRSAARISGPEAREDGAAKALPSARGRETTTPLSLPQIGRGVGQEQTGRGKGKGRTSAKGKGKGKGTSGAGKGKVKTGNAPRVT